jgi:hypothetical protein
MGQRRRCKGLGGACSNLEVGLLLGGMGSTCGERKRSRPAPTGSVQQMRRGTGLARSRSRSNDEDGQPSPDRHRGADRREPSIQRELVGRQQVPPRSIGSSPSSSAATSRGRSRATDLVPLPPRISLPAPGFRPHFRGRGEHEPKGVPDRWHLYRALKSVALETFRPCPAPRWSPLTASARPLDESSCAPLRA